MDLASLIGALATVVSTVRFAPQAWKVVRSRRTADISLRMYALSVLGFVLWLAYGFMRNEWPLIVTNSICLVLAGFILAMKLLPQPKKEAVADAVEKGLPLSAP